MTVYFYIDYMGHKIKCYRCVKNRFMQIKKGDMGYWLFAYQLALKFNIQIILLSYTAQIVQRSPIHCNIC